MIAIKPRHLLASQVMKRPEKRWQDERPNRKRGTKKR